MKRKTTKQTNFFVVCGEICAGAGEDSYLLRYGKGFHGKSYIGVFDGCGGLGARKYPSANGHSGAYIAANLARDVLDAVVAEDKFKGFNDALKAQFRAKNAELNNLDGEGIGRSDMVASLPTTAICAEITEKAISLQFIGDSRGYSLDVAGLHLLSYDNGKNHNEALFTESRLEGYVNADKDFRLAHRKVKSTCPKIYFLASDGFYSSFRTPMELEYTLLSTLEESEDESVWQTKLNALLEEIAADDYTAVFTHIGYRDFAALKSKMYDRYTVIKEKVEAMCESETPYFKIAAEELWKEYKNAYFDRK